MVWVPKTGTCNTNRGHKTTCLLHLPHHLFTERESYIDIIIYNVCRVWDAARLVTREIVGNVFVLFNEAFVQCRNGRGGTCVYSWRMLRLQEVSRFDESGADELSYESYRLTYLFHILIECFINLTTNFIFSKGKGINLLQQYLIKTSMWLKISASVSFLLTLVDGLFLSFCVTIGSKICYL